MPPPSEEGSTDASIPPAIINTSTHGGGLASGLMDSGGKQIASGAERHGRAAAGVELRPCERAEEPAAHRGWGRDSIHRGDVHRDPVQRGAKVASYLPPLAESQVGEIDMILTPFATRPLD
eukprot:CAMPEP_0180413572 /NCGR_PEP_ID=MMETSP0989-20121125/45143_1 /TAXON_ID=697907 /ORGANISM="non described non described, Strain CCMP2293" /LENGTH=120 /DNA_ID=CAMNT_0022418109 /DNA_START=90 /DNA_END=448 /DNA_ORIENTATION=+